jgi:hypothetical protein
MQRLPRAIACGIAAVLAAAVVGCHPQFVVVLGGQHQWAREETTETKTEPLPQVQNPPETKPQQEWAGEDPVKQALYHLLR